VTLTTILGMLLGLGLLVGGAQLLVRGASALALTLGISPLVVGLTVVAYGTSAPELAVSIRSALSNQTGVVLGNVIGSNTLNILLILGVAAIIRPLLVAPQLLRIDAPILVVLTGLLWFFISDGVLARYEGVIFSALLLGYTYFVVTQSRKETKAVQEQYADEFKDTATPTGKWHWNVLFLLTGLVLLAVGAEFLTGGAVTLAKALGVSDVVIGMTVVAIGTTTPELAACLVASSRGEGDIAAGNAIGSCIFNIVAVLGFGAIVAPQGIVADAQALSFGVPAIFAVACVTLPIFYVGGRIMRWEGAILLLCFAAYTAYLVLSATGSPHLGAFSQMMWWVALPVIAAVILIGVVHEIRRGKGPGDMEKPTVSR